IKSSSINFRLSSTRYILPPEIYCPSEKTPSIAQMMQTKTNLTVESTNKPNKDNSSKIIYLIDNK
ncbi:hypothetical protein, partial [Escherichia coli]|uniref:hypothetical protein n=1 Tax=Escherichia coli TaxID=562 RepID=UPI001BADA004